MHQPISTPPSPPGPGQSTPPVAAAALSPGWRAGLRAHWLALALFAVYAGRWVQYAWELRAYHAQPAPGGAGDALGWLLLGQLWFAALFGLVLLANAIWRRQGRRFYLVLVGLLLVPFVVQYFSEG